MREAVGECLRCGKPVYCEDGFLQGVVEKDGVVCFTCAEQEDEEPDE